MAHYALIDSNNIVVQVITGVDENVIQIDLDNTEVGGSSEAWEQFYASRPWFEGLTCKRTSYNRNIRANYAGIGDIYDPDVDVFIAPFSPILCLFNLGEVFIRSNIKGSTWTINLLVVINFGGCCF